MPIQIIRSDKDFGEPQLLELDRPNILKVLEVGTYKTYRRSPKRKTRILGREVRGLIRVVLATR
jgi:hypothetical protein